MFSGLPISRVLNGWWVKLRRGIWGAGKDESFGWVWFCACWSYQIAFGPAALAFVACGSARAFLNFPAFPTRFSDRLPTRSSPHIKIGFGQVKQRPLRELKLCRLFLMDLLLSRHILFFPSLPFGN